MKIAPKIGSTHQKRFTVDASHLVDFALDGMLPVLAARWRQVNGQFIKSVEQSADVVNSFGAMTKAFRMALQSAVLGLGAYLVLLGQLTPGSMIAASIMMGRALSPVEQAIGNWRGLVAARLALEGLRQGRPAPVADRREVELEAVHVLLVHQPAAVSRMARLGALLLVRGLPRPLPLLAAPLLLAQTVLRRRARGVGRVAAEPRLEHGEEPLVEPVAHCVAQNLHS